MSHKYTLKPTRPDHPVKLRPFYKEIRDDLLAFAAPLLSDLENIEKLVLHRRANPAPAPTPPTPAPTTAPRPTRMFGRITHPVPSVAPSSTMTPPPRCTPAYSVA